VKLGAPLRSPWKKAVNNFLRDDASIIGLALVQKLFVGPIKRSVALLIDTTRRSRAKLLWAKRLGTSGQAQF